MSTMTLNRRRPVARVEVRRPSLRRRLVLRALGVEARDEVVIVPENDRERFNPHRASSWAKHLR